MGFKITYYNRFAYMYAAIVVVAIYNPKVIF